MHTHSLLFPLPLPIHIGFVIVATLLMGLCYFKRRRRYELFLIVGIVSTLFVYLTPQPPWFYILGIEEIALFVLAVIDMHKVYKAIDEKEKAKKAKKTETENEDSPA